LGVIDPCVYSRRAPDRHDSIAGIAAERATKAPRYRLLTILH
jgi:hypothetical protein